MVINMINTFKILMLSVLVGVSSVAFSQITVDENSHENATVLELYVLEEIIIKSTKFKVRVNIQRKGCIEKQSCKDRKLSIDHTSELRSADGSVISVKSLNQEEAYSVKWYSTQKNNSRRIKEVIFE